MLEIYTDGSCIKDNKGGGQNRYKTLKLINYFYTLFLKLTHKTDTIMVFAKKSE